MKLTFECDLPKVLAQDTIQLCMHWGDGKTKPL